MSSSTGVTHIPETNTLMLPRSPTQLVGYRRLHARSLWSMILTLNVGFFIFGVLSRIGVISIWFSIMAYGCWLL